MYFIVDKCQQKTKTSDVSAELGTSCVLWWTAPKDKLNLRTLFEVKNTELLLQSHIYSKPESSQCIYKKYFINNRITIRYLHVPKTIEYKWQNKRTRSKVVPVAVELAVQNEAPQSGRENIRGHDFGVVESLQGQTPPDLQSAEVPEGARSGWRARFRKWVTFLHDTMKQQIAFVQNRLQWASWASQLRLEMNWH